MSFFIEILRFMDNILNEKLRDLIDNFNIVTLLLLILISFLYGIFHSAGPGHGKSLVVSLFLKEKHPIEKSLILSALISIIHTGSAIILALLFYFVFTGVKGMFQIKVQSYFIVASGVLITVVGLIFLTFKIFGKDSEKRSVKDRNLLLIGISAGIIPCPAALMISLLTLSKGIFIIGFISVVSISLGMFSLLSLIGFLSIKGRNSILLLSDEGLKRGEIFSTVIEYISILLIILIGVLMFSSILLK